MQISFVEVDLKSTIFIFELLGIRVLEESSRVKKCKHYYFIYIEMTAHSSGMISYVALSG